MATRKELDAAAQRVPNQKGARQEQVGGLTVYEVDITKVAPESPFSIDGKAPEPGIDPPSMDWAATPQGGV